MTVQTLEIPAFAPFYRAVVAEHDRGALEQAVRAVVAPDAVAGVLAGVHDMLLATIERGSFRTLLGAFHADRERRGLAADPERTEALDAFSRRLAKDPSVRGELLADHPVLARRLHTVVVQTIAAQAEVLEAFAADRDELHRAGLAPDGARVERILATSGDLHNGGRQVVGLELTGGTRVVFKPRSLAADAFVADLFAAAEPMLGVALDGCLPRFVDRGSHGWQEHVTAGPMTDAQAPGRYFERFGTLCVLLGAIGACDLHEENLIAVGERPCVCDTETIMRADAGVANDSLGHVLINQLKLSVANTMLLPMVAPKANIGLIVAAVGKEGEQTGNMPQPAVIDGRSDAARVTWIHPSYRHGDNMPRLGEEPVVALDHLGAIRRGLAGGLRVLRSGVVEKLLADHAAFPVRNVLRATQVYTSFLDAATHPDYLARESEADRLLRLLAAPSSLLAAGAPADAGARIQASELRSLDSGNVPYFTWDSRRTTIADADGPIADAYLVSPSGFAARGVAMNAERSLRYHEAIVEECLGELADGRDTAMLDGSIYAELLAGDGPLWERVAGHLVETAVRFDGPQGPEFGWIAGIGPHRDAPTLTPGNFVAFHDAGGIVTFLRRAARHDPRWVRAADAASRGLESLLGDYDEHLLDSPESLFSGAASLLLAGVPLPGDWWPRTWEATQRRMADRLANHDLGNGLAGLLLLVAGDPALAPEALESLSHGLRGALDGVPDRPWSDLAHGELGVRWALSRAAGAMGDEAGVREAADWVATRLAEAPSPAAGWCAGNAGRVLAAAEMLAAAGRHDVAKGPGFRALVEAATLPTGPAADLCVCHGAAGVVQSLLAAADALGDPALAELATRHHAASLTSAARHGFRTGAETRVSLPGYMLGWAGIADTDLLLTMRDKGGPREAPPVSGVSAVTLSAIRDRRIIR